MIDEYTAPILLIDHIELLFLPKLNAKPLKLLQSLARNHTVVASWNGISDNDALQYAKPGHPDYRQINAPQARILCI